MLRSDFLSTGTSPSVYPAPPRFRHSRAPSGIGGPEGEAPPQDAGRAPAPGARTTSMTCRGLWRSQRPISFIDPAVEASNRTTGGWEVGGWGWGCPIHGGGGRPINSVDSTPVRGSRSSSRAPPSRRAPSRIPPAVHRSPKTPGGSGSVSSMGIREARVASAVRRQGVPAIQICFLQGWNIGAVDPRHPAERNLCLPPPSEPRGPPTGPAAACGGHPPPPGPPWIRGGGGGGGEDILSPGPRQAGGVPPKPERSPPFWVSERPRRGGKRYRSS